MTALSSLQQRNRRLTYQPDSSLLLVFSTDDLACVHSFIFLSSLSQSQRHASSLQLLGVHTHSALIVLPHCHMTTLIQVDTTDHPFSLPFLQFQLPSLSPFPPLLLLFSLFLLCLFFLFSLSSV